VGLEPFFGVGIIGFNSPEWFFSDLGAIFAGGYFSSLLPPPSTLLPPPSSILLILPVLFSSFSSFPKALRWEYTPPILLKHAAMLLRMPSAKSWLSRMISNSKRSWKFGNNFLISRVHTIPLTRSMFTWHLSSPLHPTFSFSFKLLEAIVQYCGDPKTKDSNIYSWEEFKSLGEGEEYEQELKKRMGALKAENCCTLVYTSGTTGDPKGVMLSHDNSIFFNSPSFLLLFLFSSFCSSFWDFSIVNFTFSSHVDNQSGERLPPNWRWASNQLSSPKSCRCPNARHPSSNGLKPFFSFRKGKGWKAAEGAEGEGKSKPKHLFFLFFQFIGGTVWFAQPDALKGSLIETLLEVRPTIFLVKIFLLLLLLCLPFCSLIYLLKTSRVFLGFGTVFLLLLLFFSFIFFFFHQLFFFKPGKKLRKRWSNSADQRQESFEWWLI